MNNYIFQTLFEPHGSIWNYLRRAAPLQIAGAMVLGMIGIALIEPAVGETRSLDVNNLTPGALLLFVFLLSTASPAFETLLMWPLIIVVRKIAPNPVGIALVSGAAWGLLHALTNTVGNGLSTAWSFFCFTAAFQVGEMTSWRHALLTTFLMHAINNLLPTLLILLVSGGMQAS